MRNACMCHGFRRLFLRISFASRPGGYFFSQLQPNTQRNGRTDGRVLHVHTAHGPGEAPQDTVYIYTRRAPLAACLALLAPTPPCTKRAPRGKFRAPLKPESRLSVVGIVRACRVPVDTRLRGEEYTNAKASKMSLLRLRHAHRHTADQAACTREISSALPSQQQSMTASGGRGSHECASSVVWWRTDRLDPFAIVKEGARRANVDAI